MSTTTRQVILYGDSLSLQGVRAVLADRPDVELLWLDPSLEWPLETIRACCPAVFIFDMAAVGPDFQLALLQQPGLRLVGIDPETHQAVVWSGRHAAAVVAADLFNIVQESGAPA
jgi:hypothetical protein